MSRRLSVQLIAAAWLCLPLAHAAEPKRIAAAGEWELLLVDDPFADPQKGCVVQSVHDGPKGGRRERPRVRIVPGTSQMYIDPTVIYTHAVRLSRRTVVVRDRLDAERFMPENDVAHQLRIDSGKIYKAVIKDPEFGPLEVHAQVPNGEQLALALSSGASLYYRWQLDRANQTFEFKLDGLTTLLQQAGSACR